MVQPPVVSMARTIGKVSGPNGRQVQLLFNDWCKDPPCVPSTSRGLTGRLAKKVESNPNVQFHVENVSKLFAKCRGAASLCRKKTATFRPVVWRSENHTNPCVKQQFELVRMQATLCGLVGGFRLVTCFAVNRRPHLQPHRPFSPTRLASQKFCFLFFLRCRLWRL